MAALDPATVIRTMAAAGLPCGSVTWPETLPVSSAAMSRGRIMALGSCYEISKRATAEHSTNV